MRPLVAIQLLKRLFVVLLISTATLGPVLGQDIYESMPLETLQSLRAELKKKHVVGGPNYDHVQKQLDELDKIIERRGGKPAVPDHPAESPAGRDAWLLGVWVLDDHGEIEVAAQDAMHLEFRMEQDGVVGYIKRLNSWAKGAGLTTGQAILRRGSTNPTFPSVWLASANAEIWEKDHWEKESLSILWSRDSSTIMLHNLWGYNFRRGPGNAPKPSPGDLNSGELKPIEVPEKPIAAEEPEPKSKVVKLEFVDPQGNPQTHLSPDAEFYVRATYDEAKSDVPKLVLRYHQGQANFPMSQVDPKSFRTRSLWVGADVPAVVEASISATLENVTTEAIVRSDTFIWNRRGSADWHGTSESKTNWDTELSKPHSTSPRKAHHKVRIPAGGSVSLATDTTVEKLTGLGQLNLASRLSAQTVNLEDLVVSGFLSVKDKLELSGSVKLNSGAKIQAARAIFLEKSMTVASDGVTFSIPRLSSQGQLTIYGKVTANIEDWRDSGKIVLEEGADLQGSGQLFHRGEISASNSELGLFLNRAPESRILVSERLRLSGGGVHGPELFEGEGLLEFGGEHLFKRPFIHNKPWTQVNGKLTFERGLKNSDTIRLEQGELNFQHFFVLKKAQQSANHSIISESGELTFPDDAEASLQGSLKLGERSLLINAGKLMFSGSPRVIEVKGQFSNAGEVLVERGITLRLHQLKELLPIGGLMKRPLAESSYRPSNFVLDEGTWNVAGTVELSQEATGKALVAIGEAAKLVLRKGGSFGSLNKVKMPNLWNTGIFIVKEGVTLNLGTYFQTGHGILVVEKGATLVCGASVKEQSNFEVFLLNQGTAKIDGAVEVYDAYSSKFDDRRLNLGSTKITGSGTINGKPLSSFPHN